MQQDKPRIPTVTWVLTRMKSTVVMSTALSIVLLAVLLYVVSITSRDVEGAAEPKRIYFADNISPAHQKVIDLFNAKYKGRIEVVPIDMPFEKFSTNERKELFARFLRSKSNQIDVFSVDMIWVPRFAKWCEPLGRFFTARDRETIVPGALQSCLYHDTLAAVPLFMDVALLYYRKDLFRDLPDAARIDSELQASITWEKFIALGLRLRARGRSPYIFQAESYEGLTCSFVEMMEGLNNPLYGGNGFQLTSSEALRAASLLNDLIARYKISPPAVTGFRESNSLVYYLQHGGIFLRGWPTFQRDLQALAPREGVDIRQIARAPLPHFQGFPPVSILGGWNLMISKYSTQKPEALVFLKFMVSPEAQRIMYEEGGYLPVNARLYQDSTLLARHSDLGFYHHLFQHGVRRPSLVEYTKYSDIISRSLKLMIGQELSPREALQRADQEIQTDVAAQE